MNKKNPFVCHKCERVIAWEDDDPNAFIKQNQCHTIDLGRIGHGSLLNNSEVRFDLCDSCLCDYVNSLKIKETYSNQLETIACKISKHLEDLNSD